jgi:cytochrome c-type biogenesis protein CcmH
MMRRWRILLLGLALLAPGRAGAVEPDEILSDPALEVRARNLSAGLRCMVCQNESIDESHAPLARDLRQLVRERLQAGDGDEDIRRSLQARYGDFILLKPPVNVATLLLWGTPVLVLVLGGLGTIWAFRRRAPAGETALDAAEQARLHDLLGNG